MSVTLITSENDTTPVTIAIMAPITAVMPISKPFGCQITRAKL